MNYSVTFTKLYFAESLFKSWLEAARSQYEHVQTGFKPIESIIRKVQSQGRLLS